MLNFNKTCRLCLATDFANVSGEIFPYHRIIWKAFLFIFLFKDPFSYKCVIKWGPLLSESELSEGRNSCNLLPTPQMIFQSNKYPGKHCGDPDHG